MYKTSSGWHWCKDTDSLPTISLHTNTGCKGQPDRAETCMNLFFFSKIEMNSSWMTIWGHLSFKIVYFSFISFQAVLRTWIPHNLHLQSTHTLFQLSSCSWPPVNPTLFSLCVWVCKSPLCCVWAVKHPSEQRLPVRSDCYFNSRALGCLRFVCLSVWVSALKLPLGA